MLLGYPPADTLGKGNLQEQVEIVEESAGLNLDAAGQHHFHQIPLAKISQIGKYSTRDTRKGMITRRRKHSQVQVCHLK